MTLMHLQQACEQALSVAGTELATLSPGDGLQLLCITVLSLLGRRAIEGPEQPPRRRRRPSPRPSKD
jgi:hypothetical protein